jgi:PilZ domain-containing protein
MEELILNPRRSPRGAARCQARVVLEGGVAFASPAENLGPGGCQLVTSRRCAVGDELSMEIVNGRLRGALSVRGRVVWATPRPPYRIGIAFVEGLAAADDFYRRLAEAYPGLERSSAPDHLSLDTILYLGHAPHVDPQLTPADTALLREIGPGVALREFRARLGDRFHAVRGLLFSLIGRRLIVIERTRAGPPGAWSGYLNPRKK